MKITITAHPNSKRPRVEPDLFGSIHVYVNAPPLDGKANAAVQEALAQHFDVAKSKVKLISGSSSKIKRYEILE